MHSKKINLGSRDLISGLPDCLICHILSFLPTKESASTSVLAKGWRYLFALTPNLHFDDSVYLNPELGSQNRNIYPLISEKRNQTPVGFVDFVDRVLVLHGNDSLNRFSLKCEDYVHSAIFVCWILKVLERGVSDLDLQVSTELDWPLPSEMFVNKTLVRLKIGIRDLFVIDVMDVFLPKVKTLCLEYVTIRTTMLMKLLSGCQVLEELVLDNLMLEFRGSCSVSNRTLKRLTFRSRCFDGNHKSVSFDTPNLVYLEYVDTIADKYPRVCLSSLVEARIGLPMTSDDKKRADDAVDFLMCICNVRILCLSHDTLEALAYCSKPMPKFNNLIHLTIKTDTFGAWESLPALLKNCPNLETLVFEEGLHQEFIPTYISSSSVKVLKIKFRRIDYKIALEQLKHFLQTMPNLEEMIIYYKTVYEHVSTQLFQILRKVASPKCQVQLISW